MIKIKGKTILITGGTGTFGVALLKRLLNLPVKEVRIFSRDEKKQFDLKNQYGQPIIKWFIGDIKDPASLKEPMRNVDIVFHAAALKQIPTMEEFPVEATKTNVIGAENVLQAAIDNRVSKVLFLSTDKSVQPISAMGLTKALMEKIALAKASNLSKPIINIVRYGNVIFSRGSAIPLFFEQINKGIPINLYQPHSSRFLITIEEAVSIALTAIEHGKQGNIFIPKSQSANLEDIIRAIETILNIKAHIIISPIRRGDKVVEQLIDQQEFPYAFDQQSHYLIDGLQVNKNPKALKYFDSKDRLMDMQKLMKLIKEEYKQQ